VSKSLNAAFAITKTVSAVLGDSQTWRKSSHVVEKQKEQRTYHIPMCGAIHKLGENLCTLHLVDTKFSQRRHEE